MLERLVDSLAQCLVVGLEGPHTQPQLGADEHRLGETALQPAGIDIALSLRGLGGLPLLDEGKVELVSLAKEPPILLSQRVDALLRVEERAHVCLHLLPRLLEQFIGLLQIAEQCLAEWRRLQPQRLVVAKGLQTVAQRQAARVEPVLHVAVHHRLSRRVIGSEGGAFPPDNAEYLDYRQNNLPPHQNYRNCRCCLT